MQTTSSAFAPQSAPEALHPRFTIDGSEELENKLEWASARIVAGLRRLIPSPRLEGVLLGGHYGRGEGGVVRVPGGDDPDGELEFHVFMKGSRRANEAHYRRSLDILGVILAPLAGTEVRFKTADREALEHDPVGIQSHELVARHRQFFGSDRLLAGCAHHERASGIALTDATRLLISRCSALLIARDRLAREAVSLSDADFIRRSAARADLAFGDVILVARGLYHWSLRERARRLAALAAGGGPKEMREVRVRHGAAVDFLLHPEYGRSARGLGDSLSETVSVGEKIWLWLEEERLGAPFASAREYAESRVRKWGGEEPGSSDEGAETAAVRLPFASHRLALRRQRVLHALTLLLWEREAVTSPALLRRLRSELGTEASDLPGLTRAYRVLYARAGWGAFPNCHDSP